jgi:uncharacterized membrane protein YdjX (TVP38/TMEM64 family)
VNNQSHKRVATVGTNPGSAERHVIMQVVAVAAVLLLLVLGAAAWRWTPLNQWLDPHSLIATAEGLRRSPYAPLVVGCVYVAAALLVFPVTLLNTVIVIAFDPLVGASYALAGAALSAAVTYGIGRGLGRKTVRRIAGARINALSERLGRRGAAAMALVRLVPIAPYTIVNMVAGASHIGFRDFMIGTVLGLTPGIVATAIFVDRAAAAISNPGFGTMALLAAAVAAIAAAAIVLRRYFSGAPRKKHAGAR